MKHTDLLAAGAMLADKAAPYFATARAAMPIVWDERVPVVGVDKHWRCYVNPKTISQFAPAEIGFILLHELAHLLREHASRAADINAEHQRWNKAADLEINGHNWPGLQFPSCGLRPAQFNLPANLLAEDYYGRLANASQSPQDKSGRGGSQSKSSKGQLGQGGADKSNQPVSGGSCADGQQRAWEQGEDSDEPGLQPLEQVAKRMECAAKLQEHVSKTRGNAPGDWERWANSILKPSVRWGNQLRHAIASGLSRCGLGNQTYRRVKEREGGILLPRHHKREPVVLVLVDTSGSMGTAEGSPWHKAVSEVIGIAKQVGRVDCIWWDTTPHHQRGIRAIADVKARGGGGTDPEPAIQLANTLRNGSRPDMVVILSDGECSWPATGPKYPTVSVILGTGSSPTWGKTIRVN